MLVEFPSLVLSKLESQSSLFAALLSCPVLFSLLLILILLLLLNFFWLWNNDDLIIHIVRASATIMLLIVVFTLHWRNLFLLAVYQGAKRVFLWFHRRIHLAASTALIDWLHKLKLYTFDFCGGLRIKSFRIGIGFLNFEIFIIHLLGHKHFNFLFSFFAVFHCAKLHTLLHALSDKFTRFIHKHPLLESKFWLSLRFQIMRQAVKVVNLATIGLIHQTFSFLLSSTRQNKIIGIQKDVHVRENILRVNHGC